MGLEKSGNNIVVWLILGVLVLVFGLSFGLPSDSLTLGPPSLAKVYGDDIRREDWTYQYRVTNRLLGPLPKDDAQLQSMQAKEQVLEALVERDVMANLAEQSGLAATKRDAEELTRDGQLILLGDTINWLGKEKFNYRIFTKGLLPEFHVSENSYLEHQRKEVLARTFRDLIAASIAVPKQELRQQYDEQNNQIALSYLSFDAKEYSDLVDPSEEQISATIAEKKTTLLEQFNEQSTRFKGLPPQSHLSLISIDRNASNESESKAALAQIREIRRQIVNGRPFAELARSKSQHTATSRSGGRFGWVDLNAAQSASDALGLEKAVVKAALSLNPSSLSDIVESEKAYYLLRLDGQREGDVEEADGLRELAVEDIRKERGFILAKKAAEEALAAMKSGQAIDSLYSKPQDDSNPSSKEGNASPKSAVLASTIVPNVEHTGLFRQNVPIPGLSDAKQLAEAVWTNDRSKGSVLEQIYTAKDTFIVAVIEDRQSATEEGFQEARDELYITLARQKARGFTAALARRSCVNARGQGEITPHDAAIAAVIRYDSNQEQPTYNMCQLVGERGGRLALRAIFGGMRVW